MPAVSQRHLSQKTAIFNQQRILAIKEWCRGRHQIGAWSIWNKTELCRLTFGDTIKNTIKIRSFLVRRLFTISRSYFTAKCFCGDASVKFAQRGP